jgi:hypothetical protein
VNQVIGNVNTVHGFAEVTANVAADDVDVVVPRGRREIGRRSSQAANDVALGEQRGDEPAPDEAGRTGDEDA